MALTREKKEEVVEKVKNITKNAQSVTFVNFKGLGVEKVNQIRRKLKDEGVGYLVAKKSLIKRAFDEVGVSGERPPLEGEIAMAYSNDDLIAPAREIYQFQKKEAGALSIVGGIFDGSFMSMEQMTEVASIPPEIVLRGQFVNLINSPIQGFVIALDKIAEKKEKVSA